MKITLKYLIFETFQTLCEKFRAFWKRPTAITLKVTKSFLTMIIILTHMSQQSYDSYVK